MKKPKRTKNNKILKHTDIIKNNKPHKENTQKNACNAKNKNN